MELSLSQRQYGGGLVGQSEAGWRLELPAGSNKAYRLAQLDDYGSLARNRLLHTFPRSLRWSMRVSAGNLPGTWGVGFWNDPFGLSMGFGGKPWRLPAFPQVAWFMHASPPNWLSLQDSSNSIPAHGFFAGTFHAPRKSTLLMAPGLLALPLCVLQPISRLLRRLASRIIQQAGVRIEVDVTKWHAYLLTWQLEECVFSVDGSMILQTTCSPHPPLGLVLWIDNQYAAWTPQGLIRYGIMENPPAWMEITDLEFQGE